MIKKSLNSLLIFSLVFIFGCAPENTLTPLTTAVRSGSPSPANSPQPSITPTSELSPTLTHTPESGVTSDRPILIQFGADLINSTVSVNPMNSLLMAYCSPGEIHYTLDGGSTWQTVSTDKVNIAAERIGYQDFSAGDGQPRCFQAIQDPINEQSFYAVFSMVKPEFGAPPLFFMGFFTTDGGTSWQSIPPPDGTTVEQFGGFWGDGNGLVQALFVNPENPPESPDIPIVLETTDGGLTWSSGQLVCPPEGICLRWGAAASTIPGMGSPLPQPALVSLDDGITWQPLGQPVELRLPGPNQLVAFSKDRGARISGEIVYSVESGSPFLLTEDSGETWFEQELPLLPDTSNDQDVFPGLQLLPDGSLISQGAETSTWYLLPPGSSSWCSLDSDDLPSYPAQLAISNGQAWWLALETGELRSLPLDKFTCH